MKTKFKVQWKDLVTYEVEVEANNVNEALDKALIANDQLKEIDSEYQEGTLTVTKEEICKVMT